MSALQPLLKPVDASGLAPTSPRRPLSPTERDSIGSTLVLVPPKIAGDSGELIASQRMPRGWLVQWGELQGNRAELEGLTSRWAWPVLIAVPAVLAILGWLS